MLVPRSTSPTSPILSLGCASAGPVQLARAKRHLLPHWSRSRDGAGSYADAKIASILISLPFSACRDRQVRGRPLVHRDRTEQRGCFGNCCIAISTHRRGLFRVKYGQSIDAFGASVVPKDSGLCWCGALDGESAPLNETAHAVACGDGPAALWQRGSAVNGI
jgi:hypothetical protein